MSNVYAALLVLAVFVAVGTLLAVWSRRIYEGGIHDFFIGRGRVGGFLSAMSYAATTYSGFMIVGLVGLTYYTGVGALGFELTYLVSTLILLTMFARRVRVMARERGWITPSQMLGDLLGSRWIAVLVGVIYLISLVPYTASQLKSIGESVAGMAPGYYEVGVLLGLLVVVFWSYIAGIWSVAVTDAYQGIWMIAAGLGLLAYTILAWTSNGGSLTSAWSVLNDAGITGLTGFWTLNTFLAFTLPWIFFAVTNPQVVQRLYMPRDDKSLARTIRWFGVFGLIYTLTVTLIGLYARASVEAGYININPAGRDEVTPQLLSIMDPVFAGVVFTSIVAAAASTADGILLTLSSVVAVDLVKGEEAKKRRAAIVALIVFGLLAAAVALSRQGYIVQLSVLSSLMLLSLAPVTIAAWTVGVKRPLIAAVSILSGPVAVAILTAVEGDPLKAFSSYPLGAPISLWILAASTLLIIPAIDKPGKRDSASDRNGSGKGPVKGDGE